MVSQAGSVKHPLSLGAASTATPPAEAKSALCEPHGLRSIFETHYASIWRLLRRLGVRHAQLDDAAQEVFWVAARRFADIEPGREHSFLYGVALRVASQELRKKKAADPVLDLEALLRVVDLGPSPEEQLEQRQARELLDTALGVMPPELRTVFVLFELEGLEVQEIAALHEIPLGTASSRLRRAREEFSAIAKRMRALLACKERNCR
jgi:RNA polymerase sigma-70 factor (ECF subfamily)